MRGAGGAEREQRISFFNIPDSAANDKSATGTYSIRANVLKPRNPSQPTTQFFY